MPQARGFPAAGDESRDEYDPSKTSGIGETGLVMTDLGLAAKAEIEKIREQSLNSNTGDHGFHHFRAVGFREIDPCIATC